jgi:hypothetical protein
MPATAALGTLAVTVGFHDAELFPTAAYAENAVRETLRSWAFTEAN